jgi:hypothetical protein
MARTGRHAADMPAWRGHAGMSQTGQKQSFGHGDQPLQFYMVSL